ADRRPREPGGAAARLCPGRCRHTRRRPAPRRGAVRSAAGRRDPRRVQRPAKDLPAHLRRVHGALRRAPRRGCGERQRQRDLPALRGLRVRPDGVRRLQGEGAMKNLRTTAWFALLILAGCGGKYGRTVPDDMVNKLTYEDKVDLVEAENDLFVA